MAVTEVQSELLLVWFQNLSSSYKYTTLVLNQDVNHEEYSNFLLLKFREMIEFLEKIQNTDIPHESCIMSLSASITRTATTAYEYKSHSEELNIYMHPFQKKCAIRDKKNCPRCIASGKCRDKFVIDLIGKKLFADKYEKQK